MRFTCWLMFAIIATGSATSALGQVLYGSLVGAVRDPSGAAVPVAAIQIENPGTGFTRTGAADGAGAWQFENIQSGVYDVTITAQGFRPHKRAAVAVPANAVVRIDATLELGNVTEAVTVTAAAATLQTDRADVNMDLSSKELNELPVGGYRNYQSLTKLVPGVSPPAPSNSIAGNPAGSFVSNVNGTSQTNNNTRVDGASNTYLWLPQLTAYVPPIESIGTVNVVTNSYDAEQGFAGGSVVSVETKSGTNEYHGSAFEYHTNSALRARNFFYSENRLPKNIVNQFGGTFGGPVVRNKLFFFANYEGMRQRQSFSRLATVPTAAHREGNFADASTAIYDPLTGNANGTGRTVFANALIPASRLDATAKRLIALLPAPNRTGFANNYFVAAPLQLDRDNYDGKLNWNPSSKATVFGRFSRFEYAVFDPHVLGEAGGQGVATIFPGNDAGTVHSTTAGGNYVFTPTFLVDAYFGWTRQNQNGHDLFFGRNIGLDDLKLPGTNGPTIRESGFPGFAVSGYEAIGGQVPSSPRFRTDQQFQYTTNASWTRGAHSLRFGVEFINQRMNHYQPAGSAGPRGRFNYTGGVTSLNGGPAPNQFNSLAAFHLGLPSSTGKSIPTTEEMRTRQWNTALYFRDRWQVNRNITLNVGVRTEFYPMVRRDVGGVGRYDWTINRVLIGGFGQVPVDTGMDLGGAWLAPRFGLAWRLGSKTVARAGYGISIDPFALAIPLRSSYPTVIEQSAVAPNTFQPSGTTAAGIPLPAPIDISSGIVPLPPAVTTLTVAGNYRRGYVQSWNVTLQRELSWGFTGQAGYVATRSIRLTNRRDINAAAPGTNVAGRPYFAQFGRSVATTLHDPGYTSDYHSLQTKLERRMAAGWMMGTSYTFSKAITYGENSDSGLFFNVAQSLARNRSLAGFDRPHNLQIWSVADLPFGRGKRWAQSGLAAALAGGWQVNGVFSAYSGTPFSVTSAATSLQAPGNSQTADLVKPQVDIPGGVGVGNPYFDPLAFRAVTEVRFGTAGLGILRGPGLVNMDLGLFRVFRLTERFSMQFRAEAFNLSNTPHFNNPGANVSNMQLNSAGQVIRLGGFSEITSAQADERQFRLALRIVF